MNDDRYSTSQWHDICSQVLANSIMDYGFHTTPIELDSQSVTIYVASQKLGRTAKATMPIREFINCSELMCMAYILELKQRLLHGHDDNANER